MSVCGSDNWSKFEPILMNLYLNDWNKICEAKFEDEQNRSSGSGDMKSGQIGVHNRKNDDDQYYREFCCRQYCL